MVIGKDIKQMSANSHPLIRATIRQERNVDMNVMNMETFSPNPSSSFSKSLKNFNYKVLTTKRNFLNLLRHSTGEISGLINIVPRDVLI